MSQRSWRKGAMCLSIALSLAGAGTPRAADRSERTPQSPRHSAAQRAAFTALYTCTGVFTAGLTLEKLTKDVFTGPEQNVALAPTADNLKIDPVRKTVAVTYLADMPPRIAAWRPGLGCTQLPIGATAEDVKFLPRLPGGVVAPHLDDKPWPLGDREATATLPGPVAQKLDRVVAAAFDSAAYGGKTWGVLVVVDGKIVMERYGLGYDAHTPQRTNSAAKSMASTIVGIAVHQGLLDVRAPAPLREWKRPGDPRGKITLENLLRMNSGLYTENSGDPQFDLYFGGAAVADRSAMDAVDSAPGTRFVYAGSDTALTLRALRETLNNDVRYLAYPYRQLFWKIGMTRTVAETDWNGDFLMSGDVWSTARDFARLGLLYLNNGTWDGERILPDWWAKFVATPSGAQPPGSLAQGAGYGAQFWLYGGLSGLPADAYSPNGALGQYAMLVPSRNVIVVRRGFDATPGFEIAKFSADVLDALGRK
jgi:CubicO group peptidase (beta-lactamase class C family)